MSTSLLDSFGRILVVDEHNTCIGIADRLLQKGFDVAVADGYRKTFRELETASPLPDVVMLNIYLGNLDGLKILQNLAADKRYKNIKVVLTSYDGVPGNNVCCGSAVEAKNYVDEDNQLQHLFCMEWKSGTKSVA